MYDYLISSCHRRDAVDTSLDISSSFSQTQNKISDRASICNNTVEHHIDSSTLYIYIYIYVGPIEYKAAGQGTNKNSNVEVATSSLQI
jgi:hypothetical protein